MATQSASSLQQNPTIHYKLVLLGDASVGKSCLVVRYVSELRIPSFSGSHEGISMNFKNPRLVQRL